jgi:hypothetical protein
MRKPTMNDVQTLRNRISHLILTNGSQAQLLKAYEALCTIEAEARRGRESIEDHMLADKPRSPLAEIRRVWDLPPIMPNY